MASFGYVSKTWLRYLRASSHFFFSRSALPLAKSSSLGRVRSSWLILSGFLGPSDAQPAPERARASPAAARKKTRPARAFGRGRSLRQRRPRVFATGARPHHGTGRGPFTAPAGRVERPFKSLIAPRRCFGIAVVALPCI